METEKIRDLMEAYYSIYESKEESEVEEGEEEDKEEHKGKKKGKKEKEEKDEDEEEMEESVELFDYILEHLVAEGYADTNQAALAIMANMGEEWRDSIVEGMTMDDFKKQRRRQKEEPPIRKRGGLSAPEGERSIGGQPNRDNKDYWASVVGKNRDRGAGNKAKRRASELNKEEFEIEEGMTLKDFKKKRSAQKQKEKRAAEKTSPLRRAGIHDDKASPERDARHRANVDPDFDGDDSVNYPGGKLKNPKKIRKAKALGELGESAAWTKKEGKSEAGGLNEKGRKSYERENPGSDLKAPSKKVGNPRRASFCARMSGMKAKLTSKKTANDPDSRINKSLRAWNC